MTGMFSSLKRSTKEFLALAPGRRFCESFERNQRERGSGAKRVAFIALGIVLMLAGVLALVAPGPGLLMIAGGLLLIARESRLLARALDRAELAVRRAWDRSRLARRIEAWWAARRQRRAARSGR
jgi:UPF0716 family protein affecting phage T7 exclusion